MLSQGPYNYNRFDAFENSLNGEYLDEASRVAAAASDDDESKKKGSVPTNSKGKVDFNKMYSDLNKKARAKDLETKADKIIKDQRLQGKREKLERAFNKEETQMDQMNSYVNALSSMAANPSFFTEKKKAKGGKPDFPDVDKDGDKKESIAKATKELQDKCEEMGYDVQITISEGKKPAKHHKVTGVEGKAMEQGYKKNINPKTGKGHGDSKEEQEKASTDKAQAEGRKSAAMKMMSKAAGRSSKKNPGGRPGAGKRLDQMSDKIAKAMKEDINLDKEDVINWLVAEEYVTNEVSAEVMFDHMSDEFLCAIEDEITDYLISDQED